MGKGYVLPILFFKNQNTSAYKRNFAVKTRSVNEINGEYTIRVGASQSIDDKSVLNPYLILIESLVTLSYSYYFRPYSATSNPGFFCSYSYTFNPMYIDTIWAPNNGLMSVWLKRSNGKIVTTCSQYHTNLNKTQIPV